MLNEKEDIWVYRIIHVQNLYYDLQYGLYCKNAGMINPKYVSIGSQDIISRRDNVIVQCFPDTVVNDYVPFYFSVRTPMLYNIITGRGVEAKPQEEIIYLCYRLVELATDNFQWCFTDGNASQAITGFCNDLAGLSHLDWHSIWTNDFRSNNADGDEDRVRKKHSEFLVKNHVPTEYLRAIVVINETVKEAVEGIINSHSLKIPVVIRPDFYF